MTIEYIIAMWALVGLTVGLLNTYEQLVMADNWPPSNWKRLPWDAVAIIMAVCIIGWPLVLLLDRADG